MPLAHAALTEHRAHQDAARGGAGNSWKGAGGAEELVFTTRSGLPVEPRNFVRSFEAICRQAGVRITTVHHVRHAAATLLKNLGVPVRDAQLILGHSRITTTQEIYQHGDMEGRRNALERVEALFLRVVDGNRSRQNWPSSTQFWTQRASINSGGVWRIRTAHLLRAMQALYQMS